MAKKKASAVKVKAQKKKTPARRASSNNKTRQTGRWGGHTFLVARGRIFSFKDLTLKGASDTENATKGDKEKTSQGYIKRKSGSPTEATITIQLNAFAGVDVRKEALAFVAEARDGKSDFFYVGSSKLFAYKLMLISAQVKELEIAPNNTWLRADLSLTFKQSSLDGGKTSGGSSGGKRKSTKTSSARSSRGSGSRSSGRSRSGGSSKKTTKKTTKSQYKSKIVKNRISGEPVGMNRWDEVAHVYKIPKKTNRRRPAKAKKAIKAVRSFVAKVKKASKKNKWWLKH